MKPENSKNGKRSSPKKAPGSGTSKTAPKAKLSIPPVLLEGDTTAAQAQPGGPGQRYDLGPKGPREVQADGPGSQELPEAYGTRRLLLAARDPHWLYAHWDLTRDQLKEYN